MTTSSTDPTLMAALAARLSSPGSFAELWAAGEDQVLASWTAIESCTQTRLLEVCEGWVRDATLAPSIHCSAAILLLRAGHVDRALAWFGELIERGQDPTAVVRARYWQTLILEERTEIPDLLAAYQRVVDDARGTGDVVTLVHGLVGVAWELWGKPDAEGTSATLDEAERWAREGDHPRALDYVIAARANLCHKQGKPEEALAHILAAEEICRARGLLIAMQWNVRLRGDIIWSTDRAAAFALYEEGERQCRKLGYERGLCGALQDRGWGLRQEGKGEQALALQREREMICRRLGKRLQLRGCLSEQGILLHDLGRFAEALTAHRECEALCRAAARLPKASLAHCLDNQADIHLNGGELGRARELYEAVESFGRELEDRQLTRLGLNGLARVLSAEGREEEALPIFREIEQMCGPTADRHGLVNAIGNQAAMVLDLGRTVEALPLLRRQEALASELKDTSSLICCYANLGMVHKTLGRPREAAAFYAREEALCRSYGRPGLLARCLEHRASLRENDGDHEGALALYAEALELARVAGGSRQITLTLINRAIALERAGRLREALRDAEEAHALAQRCGFGDRDNIGRIKANMKAAVMRG